MLEWDLLVVLIVVGIITGLVINPDSIILLAATALSIAFFLDRVMKAASFCFFKGSAAVLSFLFIPAYLLSLLV
jgi:hypothetical protein